ncbi:MAG: glycine--tRNA ligase [Candidatus Nealsonbacteria bacterium CG23_combo_of_CG06-09_8_20_14_all_40_13]|uniref:Glycine--tRNA ligase n=1 Tax=Candidatus Nealsonbacteria bacterium CG23_combo_of_CG06-09_8_20_14_all_40_13 TaxID=1974724 RepID=A0A2G9YTP7_9BACT|nr:MAG: glycine--tRNA ligase [Candidatus Nealsonbacteria bacterium CG23_combo_of_CG06-09_8_20_14_all_40_13]
MENENKLEKIVSWAKRRGFIWPSSEIYGGIGGFYDFGPYGVELKNNIKNLWWKTFVQDREDVVGLESSVIMSNKVWQASGHEKGFIDQLVECKKCHQRFKVDDLTDEKCQQGGKHEFTSPKSFNAMFKTHIGVVEDQSTKTYLRPETAQGMFVDFKQILETSRLKLPFGIAQIGKSFRNEINTKDFLFRVREFEIAEIEYFVKSGQDEKYFDQWLADWQKFILNLGIKKENLKLFEHPKKSLAHYSKRTVDINYNFPFGWKELAGVANRTDFDLSSHEKASGRDLKYFDQDSKEKYWPYVIEPTLGIERLALAVICEAFEETKSRTTTSQAASENEIVLHFTNLLAPVKVAVFPLVNKEKLPQVAQEIYQALKPCWNIFYDETGSIGRRYRRQDEIGTPYCVTVDFQTLKDKTVTLRDRDSMKQGRIKITDIKGDIAQKLGC